MPGTEHSGSYPPGVLVSSTFYDLRQIREDLRRFLEDELGYRPLLSEHPSFPINPDVTTVESCRERVAQDADILVFVVGRRYGTIDDRSAKSVTSLEYLAARQKGIPIYARGTRRASRVRTRRAGRMAEPDRDAHAQPSLITAARYAMGRGGAAGAPKGTRSVGV